MKYCPKCLNEYADESKKFCGLDGSALVSKEVGGNKFCSHRPNKRLTE